MKKTIKIYALITIGSIISLTSCQKDSSEPMDSFNMELAGEQPNVRLSSTGYEVNISEELKQNGLDYYTEGIIEYKLNNQVIAFVDFGDGSNNAKASLTKGNTTSEFDLKTKKDNSKYKKVIVKPLVKSNDCKYIVEGIIKYFDYKTEEYIATVDFGNGTCDEWVTKSWPASSKYSAGSKTFSLNDLYKKDIKK